jgi:hypothetical protein
MASSPAQGRHGLNSFMLLSMCKLVDIGPKDKNTMYHLVEVLKAQPLAIL